MSDIKLGLVYEIRYLNYPAFNVLVKLALSQILGKGKQTSESKHIDEIRTKSEYPTTLNCIIWVISGRITGSSKKIPAKFSDTCSVRADGLCIGCLGQWAERWQDNSNMQEFFRTTL